LSPRVFQHPVLDDRVGARLVRFVWTAELRRRNSHRGLRRGGSGPCGQSRRRPTDEAQPANTI
jgi:hypothetical protein